MDHATNLLLLVATPFSLSCHLSLSHWAVHPPSGSQGGPYYLPSPGRREREKLRGGLRALAVFVIVVEEHFDVAADDDDDESSACIMASSSFFPIMRWRDQGSRWRKLCGLKPGEGGGGMLLLLLQP